MPSLWGREPPPRGEKLRRCPGPSPHPPPTSNLFWPLQEEFGRTWKKEGWKGLFKGNGANCLKVAPSRGTQFLVFEFMKRRIVAGTFFFAAAGTPLNAFTRLFAGGVAGMVAAAVVYPLEVIKTILTAYPDEASGIGEAVEAVFKIGGGFKGLYAGLLPTLVAMFPYIGVEFMVYETNPNPNPNPNP